MNKRMEVPMGDELCCQFLLNEELSTQRFSLEQCVLFYLYKAFLRCGLGPIDLEFRDVDLVGPAWRQRIGSGPLMKARSLVIRGHDSVQFFEKIEGVVNVFLNMKSDKRIKNQDFWMFHDLSDSARRLLGECSVGIVPFPDKVMEVDVRFIELRDFRYGPHEGQPVKELVCQLRRVSVVPSELTPLTLVKIDERCFKVVFGNLRAAALKRFASTTRGKVNVPAIVWEKRCTLQSVRTLGKFLAITVFVWH